MALPKMAEADQANSLNLSPRQDHSDPIAVKSIQKCRGVVASAATMFAAVGAILSTLTSAACSNEPVIDPSQHVCIRENYDRLGELDVSGKIRVSPNARMRHESTSDIARLAELNRLLTIHNDNASEGGPEYDVILSPEEQMRAVPYLGLAGAILCEANDTKKCRNMNFWTSKKIDELQMLGIMFSNIVVAHPNLKICSR